MPPSIAELQRENKRLAARCQQLDAELTELRQRYQGGSQLEGCDLAAEERAKLLSTVAQVANLLLRSQDYTTILPDVIRLLGEAVGSDRCAITQEMLGNTDHLPRVRLLNEWHREDVPSVLQGSPEFAPGVEIDIPASFHQPLLRGEAVNFVVTEVEELAWRDFFEAHHNVAMLIVPIMLSEGCWGHIGFDNCQDASLFDEAEIAILQIAAESIAAAIERQHQNEALRESEERYRTLFELSGEGIFRFEFEPSLSLALSPEQRMELGYQVNQIVEVNHAFVEQYGFDTPEDLVGTKIGDFYDHEYSQANDQVNLDLVRDLRVSKIETVETDRLGNRHWFISSVVCDVRDDTIVGGWGVQTDITELKQAQQSLLEAEQARALELERYNTELKQAVEQLQARDLILELTATLANELLSATELDTSINSALQMIGETLGTDRVNVIENIPPQAGEAFPSWRVLYEWDSLGTLSQLAHAVTAQGSYEDIQWLYELFQHHRQSASYIIEEAPEPFRSQQMAIGVKSTHIVPIFINENWWGAVAFDDCQERRERDPAELSVLKTAAACIGSAIERDRTQKAILQAEQERSQELQQMVERLQARDLILEATAEAANALLSTDNLDNAVDIALQIIGQSLDTDRVNIIEIEPFDQGSNLSQVGWQILNEWTSPFAVSQRSHPIHQRGDHTGIEDWLQLFSSGQSASFLLEELPEPFRSGQAEIGVKVYHTVPIFLEGHYWGNLGIDECREAKHRDPAKLAVLKTVAACIGSAIERDRTQKAMLQAEQVRAQELQQMVERLQTRDLILNATAESVTTILTDSEFDRSIDKALEILGTSVECDRVEIFQHFADDTEQSLGVLRLQFEWYSTYATPQQAHPTLTEIPQDGLEALWLRLKDGECLTGTIESYPEPFRSGQIELGVQSTHAVPIFVEGHYWGIVAIDHCREQRQLTPVELSVFKTAATCIGSAIERDRTQKAILAAEQAKAQELRRLNTELQTSLDDIRNRDFIAETAATVANVLLREDTLQSAITQALGFLGKALSLDRVAIIEVSVPSPDISSVMWHISYEWDSPATISQINHSRLAQGTFEGIEALYEQMSSGQVISYLLEELPEPFRSGQAELGVKTLHDVPIFVADEFWGAIGFDDCHQAKRLSQTELSMLKIAADCIGSAIQRERLRLAELRTQQALLKAQQDQVAELVKTNQALKNSLDRLAAAPDLEAFLGYVLTEISQQFDGKTASLYLFNPDSQTLHLHQWVAQERVYSRQEFYHFGPLAEPIAVTDSTAWAFLQQHKFPLVINRDNAHQYMFPGTEDWQLDWADREDLQSGINILLSSGETPLGMMCMYSASRSTFTSEELEIAQALSHQATLAIQLTRLAAEAQQSAILGERNRLARDIHDTLAQSLGGIVLHLQAADSVYTTDLQDKQTHFTQARQLAKQALTEARRSVQALRPQLLEQATLDQALNKLLQQLTRNSPLQITYELHGSPYGLPPDVEEHLLRIGQEAITNSLRHAQATELIVDFTYEPRQVQLRIQDNGQGFDTTLPTFGYGLITMQERAQQIAAHLSLSSQLGQGTIVHVTLPIVTTLAGILYD